MAPIYQNLYQFTTYIAPMDFTIHQYLLATEPAILFAAGTIQQAKAILPQIKKILSGKELKYIFVSHMESDECGGLPVLLQAYPEVTVICSALGERELPGYGYSGKIAAATPDKPLIDGKLSLKFFNYPAEVHLQNGVICYEETSGIFYSADLMLRYGNAGGKTITRSWDDEVMGINQERVPNEAQLKEMQDELMAVAPKLIAVGHGFCVKCE